MLVRMPPELHAEVKVAAAEEDMSMAQFIRAGVRMALQDRRTAPVRRRTR